MKKLASGFLILISILGLSLSARAAEIQIFGPQELSVRSTPYSANFATPAGGPGRLKVVQGDGQDLTPKSCSLLSKMQKIQCQLLNALNALNVALSRPKNIEIKINNIVYISKQNLSPAQGEIELIVPLLLQNQIQIKMAGQPWTTATVAVKAIGPSNQLPIPLFSMTPNPGVAPETVILNAIMSSDPDGQIQDYEWDFGDGTFSAGSIVSHIYPNPGLYQVKLTVTDNQGGKAFLIQNLNLVTNQPPVANFMSTVEGLRVSLDASLSSDPENAIVEYLWNYGDGQTGSGVQSTHEYSSSGTYQVTLTVKDHKGSTHSLTKPVTVIAASPPIARITPRSPTQGLAPLLVYLDGSASSDPHQLPLTYRWLVDGVQISEESQVTYEFKNSRTYAVKLTVTNSSNQSHTTEISVIVSMPVLPPSPETVAPPLAENQVMTLGESAQFLFTGSDPIQKNVVLEEMDSSRLAVISGRVFDEEGNPLSGVSVRVLSGAIYGFTLTRADGRFDLAVNGGGEFILHFERNGYLSAQRKTDTKALQYSSTNEVSLVRRDPKVTKVSLNAPEYQVAQGSLVTDDSGSRTATLLIPSQTTAKLILPSGAEVAAASLALRATEYTVGSHGPQRMPAELPQTSGYTYAVDVSSDEAVALGAQHIRFNKPVPFYVDNFLNFPVGTIVPLGIYNFSKALWEPQPNGLVLKVIAINNGVAALAVDASGQAASVSQLNNLGITEEELRKIATLYPVGKTLSRVQTDHFSPLDLNYPREPETPVGDNVGGNSPPIISGGGGGNAPRGSCPLPGSVINTSSQTLGEIVPLQGLDHVLTYSTSRMPGRKAENTLWIPVSQSPLGASLKVEVAGRILREELGTMSTLKQFVWDGKDAYGRQVQGVTGAKVTLSYRYPASYLAPRAGVPQFGRFGGGTNTGVSSRTPLAVSSTQTKLLGTQRAYSGLGGWGLAGHHFYDAANKVLHLSDGTRIETKPEAGEDFNLLMSTLSGSDEAGFSGDGSHYRHAKFNKPGSLLAADDTSLYVIDSGNLRIRKITPDGIIQTIAGNGTAGLSGDNGDARLAQINVTENSVLAQGPDGAILFSDTNNHCIRKIDKDGIISTVAGTGVAGFSGDEGDAKSARLSGPEGVTFYEGQIYIADTQNNRIRVVGVDNLIYSLIGDSSQTSVQGPHGVSFGLDGVLYFSTPDTNQVRKISTGGRLQNFGSRLFVGAGSSFFYNGSPPFRGPSQIYVAKDGREFVINRLYQQIWVSRGQTMKVFAGGGSFSTGDNVYLNQANLDPLNSMAFDNKGRIYLTQGHKIRMIKPILPDLEVGTLRIVSKDGNEIYLFNSKGQHLETLSALTGASVKKFEYDPSGLLISVSDVDQKKTVIERDSNGLATAIRGPFGQKVNLSYSADGYLSSVTQAGGEKYQFIYDPGGLLSRFIKPNGATSRFQYDGLGQLLRDEDHMGGFTQLVKTLSQTSSEVRVSRPLMADQVETLTVGSHGQTRLSIRGSDNKTRTTSEFENFAFSTDPIPEFNNTTVHEIPEPRLGSLAKMPYMITSFINSLSLTRTYTEIQDLFNYKRVDQLSYRNTATEISFDSATKTLMEKNGRGTLSESVLDSKERIISSTHGNLTPMEFTYNSLGQMTQIKQGARVQSYLYNSQGLLASKTDTDGRSVSYTYDASSRVTAMTTNNNRQVQFAYDQNGNLTSLTPPGKRAHLFGINILDMMTSYLPPSIGGSQMSTSYEYDLRKRLTLVRRPDGSEIRYAYQTDGKIQSITTADGVYEFGYDTGNGLLTRSLSPDGIQIVDERASLVQPHIRQTGPVAANYFLGYTVFPWGMESSYFAMTDWPSHNFGNTYDQAGLLYNIGGSLHLTRGEQNDLIKSVNLTSVILDYDHNSFGEEISTHAHLINEAPFYSRILNRDSLGRVTQKTETANSVTRTLGYSYDNEGRLVDVTQNGVAHGLYEYDSNGNRTKSVINGVSKNAVYDDQDRLVSYGTKSYTHNLNGELTSVTDSATSSTKTFSYTSFGNIKTAQVNGKSIQYLYDANNRRVGKKVNGVLNRGYLYHSQTQIIAELDGANQLISTFIYGSKSHVPDAMTRGTEAQERYLFITDQIGSVRFVVDVNTGAIAQELDYDEFGNVIKDTNPGFQPFGFAGGLYDRDTGLVRFGARDYDAETGRWTTKDPIGFGGGDTNLYGYVVNDPINFIDPEGTVPVPLILGVLAGVFYATDTDTPGAAQSEMIGVPLAVAGGWAAGGGVCKATDTSIKFRKYPNSGGGGVGLYRNNPLPNQSRNIIRVDVHPLQPGGRSLPHVDIPGVVKHWPWGK